MGGIAASLITLSACILLHRMCYLQQYLSLTCEQPEHEPWVMNAHP